MFLRQTFYVTFEIEQKNHIIQKFEVFVSLKVLSCVTHHVYVFLEFFTKSEILSC